MNPRCTAPSPRPRRSAPLAVLLIACLLPACRESASPHTGVWRVDTERYIQILVASVTPTDARPDPRVAADMRVVAEAFDLELHLRPDGTFSAVSSAPKPRDTGQHGRWSADANVVTLLVDDGRTWTLRTDGDTAELLTQPDVPGPGVPLKHQPPA